MNYNLKSLDAKYYKSLLIIFLLSYVAAIPLYQQKKFLFDLISSDLLIILVFLYIRKITIVLIIILFLQDIIASNLLGMSLGNFLLLRAFFNFIETKNLNNTIILSLATFVPFVTKAFLNFLYQYPVTFDLYGLFLSNIFLPILLIFYKK